MANGDGVLHTENFGNRLNGVSQLDVERLSSFVYGGQNSLACGHGRTTVNSTDGADYNVSTGEFADIASSTPSTGPGTRFRTDDLSPKQALRESWGRVRPSGKCCNWSKWWRKPIRRCSCWERRAPARNSSRVAIHDRSRRKNRAFVKLNCAAIPSGLLESELFGHERGAFTGAVAQKTGRVELADQGSLFLDEIGDIPLELQAETPARLAGARIRAVGQYHERRQVNVRVMAATHRNLEEMICEKQFRRDLYYRLNIFPIYIPPLRERPEDIPLLVRHFVREFARRMNKTIDAISTETMESLTQYSWPGNIRELQNVIERSVVVHQKGNFSVRKSCSSRDSFPSRPVAQTSLKRSAIEDRRIIAAALAEAGGRVAGPSGAAVMLGIPPSTLESKIRSMNINKYSFRAAAKNSSRTSRIHEEVALL